MASYVWVNVIDGFGRIWTEAAAACFNVLALNLSVGLRKIKRKRKIMKKLNVFIKSI
jgi:hypothetical protein